MAVLLIFNHVRGTFKVLLVKLLPICVSEEERVEGGGVMKGGLQNNQHLQGVNYRESLIYVLDFSVGGN